MRILGEDPRERRVARSVWLVGIEMAGEECFTAVRNVFSGIWFLRRHCFTIPDFLPLLPFSLCMNHENGVLLFINKCTSDLTCLGEGEGFSSWIRITIRQTGTKLQMIYSCCFADLVFKF